MNARIRNSLIVFAGSVLLQLGCSRQDTECLAKIGRRLVEHTQQRIDDIGTKVDASLKGKGAEGSHRDPE